MLRTLVKLEDGTEIFSGPGTKNAIKSATVTEFVNNGQELALGSTCANILELQIITREAGLQITAGDELIAYNVDDNDQRHIIGTFTAEKPTRPSANSMSITAYDRVIWLDKDLSEWLLGLQEWPYTLFDFACMVCAECGLELLNTSIPNGDYKIKQFSADGITGRQLMQWVGQIAGRFCRATVDGKIEFAWYSPVISHEICATGSTVVRYDNNGNLAFDSDLITASCDTDGNLAIQSDIITAVYDGTGNLELIIAEQKERVWYYQNGLSYENYTVAGVEKVQLRQNDDDVGTVYPDGITGPVNTYIITGNYLLSSSEEKELLPIAKILYEQLKDVSYTPCKVSVPSCMGIHAGNTVTITDKNGNVILAYIMKKVQKGQRDVLECTGSSNRQSSTAINNKRFESLEGKVLNLRYTVDGFKVENANMKGALASLEVNLGGISERVESQQEVAEGLRSDIAELKLSSDQFKLDIKNIQDNGTSRVETSTGYTFSEEGLRIKKSGQQIENLIDNTGMYVKRNGSTLLKANSDGVEAHDVTVRNYLIVGEHARFEDYTSGRTACYYWEES